MEAGCQSANQLTKSMRTAAIIIVSFLIIGLTLLSLCGCNFYVTLIQTQGHAEDVVDDSGEASAVLPVHAM